MPLSQDLDTRHKFGAIGGIFQRRSHVISTAIFHMALLPKHGPDTRILVCSLQYTACSLSSLQNAFSLRFAVDILQFAAYLYTLQSWLTWTER